MSIHLPVDDILAALERSGWGQGDWGGDRGPICLHEAIRRCTFDGPVVREVSELQGWGPAWNDDPRTTRAGVSAVLKVHAEITDDELADTFGPQWLSIVELAWKAGTLTGDEIRSLSAAWRAARFGGNDGKAAIDAAAQAVRDALEASAPDDMPPRITARITARIVDWGAGEFEAPRKANTRIVAARAASHAADSAAACARWSGEESFASARVAGLAALALSARDLIGSYGLTQRHYDTLMGPWAAVVGPAHPGDAD